MRKHLLAIVAASTLVIGSSAFAADLEEDMGTLGQNPVSYTHLRAHET